MSFIHASRLRRIIGNVVATIGLLAIVPFVRGEEQLADPSYRVAIDTPATQQAPAQDSVPARAASATIPAPAAPPAFFDLTQKPGEHPLTPVLRVVKLSQEEIDRNIRDYSCTLHKQERIDGELGEKQQIFLKVMHEPFSVYMSFLQPYAGREVVYVAGQNDGDLVVLETGIKRIMGKMNLDPNGSLAMRGQRHPITSVGMRNLTVKLTKMWEAETKFAECEVTSNPDTKIDGRSTTMVQVLHPVPRQDFKFHAARLFFDNELKVPIHFDAFTWPEQVGAEPSLEESYTYTRLKLNNGCTAREFDAKNNPEIFKQ